MMMKKKKLYCCCSMQSVALKLWYSQWKYDKMHQLQVIRNDVWCTMFEVYGLRDLLNEWLCVIYVQMYAVVRIMRRRICLFWGCCYVPPSSRSVSFFVWGRIGYNWQMLCIPIEGFQPLSPLDDNHVKDDSLDIRYNTVVVILMSMNKNISI